MIQSSAYTVLGLSGFELSLQHVKLAPQSPLNIYRDHHIHHECEIYLNLSGDVSFMVENTLYPISRGSVILTRPYEYHHCVYHSNAMHDHYWMLFSVQGNERLLDLFFERRMGEQNLIVLSEAELEQASAVMERLLKPASAEPERLSDFLRLLELLQKGKRGTQALESAQLPQDVAIALRLIHADFREPISIRALAEAAHVSINTLERHFSATLGESPMAFLRRKRLLYAAELLRTGVTVTEAFSQSGFSDYSHFISLFRKTFGQTPLRYQKGRR